ncbi:hypothetical protein C8J56DRAFT_894343 [Mycena floridula]|nr:hypothetical protein C8J56DRAFT_894343 [Mycena floridula]
MTQFFFIVYEPLQVKNDLWQAYQQSVASHFAMVYRDKVKTASHKDAMQYQFGQISVEFKFKSSMTVSRSFSGSDDEYQPEQSQPQSHHSNHSSSHSTAMSMATLSQILQQNPGLVSLLPLSVAPPSSPTPALLKPVNMNNLFVAPMLSNASFKLVVHKFLQPSPCPLVKPVAKKSTSKSLHKTEAPAVAALPSSSRKPPKVVVEVPMSTFLVTHSCNLRSRGPVKRQASVAPSSRKPPAKRAKKEKSEEPEAIYSNEEDAEEAVIELSSDKYKCRHHLLALSEIVNVWDLLVPHLQHPEKIGYHELNLLRSNNMVHVVQLAGACSFCALSPVKSSLCEKAICGGGSHDNCTLCSADHAKSGFPPQRPNKMIQ